MPKTGELVAGRLRRQIIKGELAEGEALPPEAQLMEEFGVSRPTLREAFRVLESEALITVRRGSRGGARVRTPDIGVAARYAALLLQVSGATLKDVYDARLIVEPAAARMLAERKNRQAVANLQAIVDEEGTCLDDPEAHGKTAVRFHETLVDLAGNTTLAVLVGMLNEITEEHMAIAVRAANSAERRDGHASGHRNRARGTKAHARLVELIRAGDGAEAERFWRLHMEAAGQILLREFGATTVVDLLG